MVLQEKTNRYEFCCVIGAFSDTKPSDPKITIVPKLKQESRKKDYWMSLPPPSYSFVSCNYLFLEILRWQRGRLAVNG